MEEFTRKLWEKQDRHDGDRERLFRSVAEAVPEVRSVVYPGSFVDLAPSFVWPAVTYVDLDRRAARFFADSGGIDDLLREHGVDPGERETRFLHADYTDDLELSEESFDLLVSLYAGPISEHCTELLRVGGWLLANPSHGDVALASIDSRYRLSSVITSRAGSYRVDDRDLGTYLVPKREVEVTVDLVHRTGRGIAYTRSPFAYLFQRIG